jgi:hypothetical protein
MTTSISKDKFTVELKFSVDMLDFKIRVLFSVQKKKFSLKVIIKELEF